MTIPTHCRCFKPGEDRERFVHYYRRLSELGLAPAIIEDTPSKIVTREWQGLSDWLETPHSPDEKKHMGRRIADRLEELHTHGICHRDAHVLNVVLADGLPLLVDPAFAIDTDPERPCYDLYGPQRSGAPVPQPHLDYPANRGGVWWDCTAEVPTLGRAFGALAKLRAS